MKRLALCLLVGWAAMGGVAQAHRHYWRWHSAELAPHSTAQYATPGKFVGGAATFSIRVRQAGTVFPAKSPEVHYRDMNDFEKFFWLGPLTGTAQTSDGGPLIVRMANFGDVTLTVRVGYRVRPA